jgi:hypothetical protein
LVNSMFNQNFKDKTAQIFSLFLTLIHVCFLHLHHCLTSILELISWMILYWIINLLYLYFLNFSQAIFWNSSLVFFSICVASENRGFQSFRWLKLFLVFIHFALASCYSIVSPSHTSNLVIYVSDWSIMSCPGW